jgi:hypothetical protein
VSLAIDKNDTSLDFDLALSVARNFRITTEETEATVDSILATVSAWRERANVINIGKMKSI